MFKSLTRLIRSREFRMRGIFISTYIPRRCGIATFTKDLTNAINILNPDYLAEIMAMDDEREPVEYPWEVKMRIHKENPDDYIGAADYINKSSSDFVSIQHEYGIFGAESGKNILDLARRVKKPIITTFHTTLADPTYEQKIILQKLAERSTACVVMIKEAAMRLKNIYKINPKKIVIIHHGVPNIPFSPSYMFKKTASFSEKSFLIGAINLVAPNKGLEYLIDALPMIKKVEPNVKFVMVGQTHPLVKISENENYRNFLKKKIADLDLKDNFVEINEYVDLETLISYLKALDIYITPYLDMNQTSSGTLAYAIGAGKVCISTPYIYAKEVLARNRGILITPQEPAAIAEAVIKIIKNKRYRAGTEQKAYKYGRSMIWERVALEYLILFKSVLNSSKK